MFLTEKQNCSIKKWDSQKQDEERFSDNFQMYVLKVFKETCHLASSIIFKVKIILFNPIEMVVKICLFDEEKDRNFWSKSFHSKMEIYQWK